MASGSEKKKDKTKIKSNTPAKERGKRMKRANQKTKDFIERQKQKMGGNFHFNIHVNESRKRNHI